jgi:hypothetical protein
VPAVEQGEVSKHAIEAERALAAHAGLRQQSFGSVQPIVAAREQTDDVQETVQAAAGVLAAPGAGGHHHGLRLQPLEPVAQLVFLVAEDLRAAPQQQAERRPGEQEKEQVDDHTVLIP